MSVFVAFNIFVFVCLYVCVFVFVCLCVQVCSRKVQPSEHEKSVISALDSASGLTRGTLGGRRRRMRAKGPNPLSVKKGRRKFVSTQELPGRIMSQSKVSTTEDTSLNRTPFPTPSNTTLVQPPKYKDTSIGRMCPRLERF